MHTIPAHEPTSGVSSAVLAVIKSVLSPLTKRYIRARGRRNVRAMLELDDRTLRDIGLSRDDVCEAAMAAGAADPAGILRQRRADRLARHGLMEPVVPRRTLTPALSKTVTGGHWPS